ncbi:MAG: sulfite reductase subunit alpha [Verrucomicrobiales bacterium]
MDNSTAESIPYSRKNPLVAQLLRRRLLSEGCEEKETWHLEIDLADSGLAYQPGDSLAVFSTNCPELVEDLLAALSLAGDETVTAPGGNATRIREALFGACAITQPDKKFLKALVEKAGEAASEIAALLEPEKKAQLADYLWGREIIDFILMFPELKWEPQEFVDLLKKLNVRLYSIASSLRASPREVHLTVAVVKYRSFERTRKGVCSSFLANRVDEQTAIPCFITPGKGFRLPDADENTPVIMIGPGTGIAPFRAFLQERAATEAAGKAWLFFGEIHEESTYFYRDEWEKHLADGTLAKITTAFSRDQDHKIYVHHRMEQEAAELWQWLEQGAILYVCGDASRMAKDVDRALHALIAQQGAKNEQEAADYVAQMKKDKRYRRDVY